MTPITLRFHGNNHVTWLEAVGRLGSQRKAHTVFRRALNHTGSKAKTAVYAELSKQVGLPQRDLKKYGALAATRADYKDLAYQIGAKGDRIPLKVFGARQFAWGVRAKPYGESKRFPGTFIFAGTPTSGKFVSNGNVFNRRTAASLPIKIVYGPSIPVELVRNQSKKAFEDAALKLGERVEHEIKVLTDGVVS